MEEIRQAAVKKFENDNVICAKDLMIIEVPPRMELIKNEDVAEIVAS